MSNTSSPDKPFDEWTEEETLGELEKLVSEAPQSPDAIDARMKFYESVETERRFDPHLPIYVRVDGRAFAKFTQGMNKPFDLSMARAMLDTAEYLVEKTHARVGYVQSDEISLIFLARDDNPNADVFFSAKVFKMTSVIASMAAARFAAACPLGFRHKLPHFDCRVMQLPSKAEAANAILWRARDARKNAVIGLAQSVFSHKDLHGKHHDDMLRMLCERDVYFDTCPPAFRNGTIIKRKAVSRCLTQDELSRIPEKFRTSEPVIRNEIEKICEPFFGDVEDRESMIFD